MSPGTGGRGTGRIRFPRPRGDEPRAAAITDPREDVFPARAGMSLGMCMGPGTHIGFPRPRGDEPRGVHLAGLALEFSPPARG